MVWEDIRLQSTGHIVGVLFAAAGGVDVAAVILLIEDILRVLLGFVGGVWVISIITFRHGGTEGRGRE